MPENGHTTRVMSGDSASSPSEALWDDEDTRGFYECLPDLRFIFGALLMSMVIPCQAIINFFALDSVVDAGSLKCSSPT